jgi:hypothetical protein
LDVLRDKYNVLNNKSVSDLTSEEVVDAYATVKTL